MFFFFFNEHSDELLKAANDSKIMTIIQSDEYYFQRALDKYIEFKQLEIEDSILDELIVQSQEKPFSFEKFLNGFDTATQQYKLLRVIGQLVSYIDKSAAMKNTLNEYSDKRTMALTFVNQTIWVQSFLKFKRGSRLTELPKIIENTIKYVEHPDKNVSIFSEKRKEQIFNYIFEGQDGDIFKCMAEIGIQCKNPMNDGYVYSAILHSEKIQQLWKNDITTNNQRIWAFTPGENAHLWDECKEKGIMAIGWDEIGDLRQFNSKDQIKQQLKIEFGTDSSHMNSGLALWQFCNEIKIGDKIFAKVGSKTLLGVGEVTSDYEYDENRENYRHVRNVKWLRTGKWVTTEKFAIKTLTDITVFEDFCNGLDKLIEDSEATPKGTSKKIPYDEQDFLADVFMSKDHYDTLLQLLERKKNIILQGSPGVGKTFMAKRLAYSLMGEKDESRIEFVQFHQSYSYEDFVMGYRPDKDGFSLKQGSFYRFCKRAEKDTNRPYYFIIDEINRGNLSKIFGELLMLIECDKRGQKVVLTYSDTETFFVPENLHIIGMMNTADRSLAIIDYALRRRFCFFEVEPAFEKPAFEQYLLAKSVNNDLVKKIITRFTYLNNKIANDSNLGSGFRIGHSYFCDCKNVMDGWYETIIRYEIAPLLEEYWFDDIETAKTHISELVG